MEEIQYIGEHLWPRHLGPYVSIISFCAVVTAAIGYALAVRRYTQSVVYTKTANRFFGLHTLATLLLMGLMFYVMFNRYYEYAYAYEHVSDDLEFKYMFSAFWEGQSGSFLLWMFWHIVLGWIIIRRRDKWTAPVMIVLCTVQAWLASTMLGVYLPFGSIQIGDQPLLLLREVLDIPLFANEDYLSLLEGRGLNILLQNYWNVIHPPITFLGFASVTIPFGFALGSLFIKEYRQWLIPSLPWVLFSVGMLGVGILMGSAWAYESLTFGGFWAWDPVENMSLVPWIMLLAGLHAHLVSRTTGHSLRSAYLFYTLAFCLSIYSTYLVRSGALEDTSVHAFTEMGYGLHLTAFILFVVITSLVILISQWKRIPSPAKEESGMSREMWMFVGLLVMAISSLLITYSTSMPVINKLVRLFDPDYEGVVIQNADLHYNKYQIWIASIVVALTGLGQHMRYKLNKVSKHIFRRIMMHVGCALLAFALSYVIMKPTLLANRILLTAGVYGLVANLDYFLSIANKSKKMAGSVLSHIGFAIMLVGIVLNGVNQHHVTNNPQLMSGIFNSDDEEDLKRSNIILLKGEPVYSQGYLIEYEDDIYENAKRRYAISFKQLDETGGVLDSFTQWPSVEYNETFDNIAAYYPDVRHEWWRDQFTRITTLPRAEVEPEFAQSQEDTLSYQRVLLGLGESVDIPPFTIRLEAWDERPDVADLPTHEQDIVLGVKLLVRNNESGAEYTMTPRGILRGHLSYVLPEKLQVERLRIKLSDSLLLPYVADQFIVQDSILLRPGEVVMRDGVQYRLNRYVQDAVHPYYRAKDKDLTISAQLTISQGGQNFHSEPMYVLRGREIMPVDDFIPELGLRVRFAYIDPSAEAMTLQIQKFNHQYPIYIATSVPRSDFVVIESQIFPGIKLFWIGAIMMLLGVFYSMWQRRLQLKNQMKTNAV